MNNGASTSNTPPTTATKTAAAPPFTSKIPGIITWYGRTIPRLISDPPLRQVDVGIKYWEKAQLSELISVRLATLINLRLAATQWSACHPQHRFWPQVQILLTELSETLCSLLRVSDPQQLEGAITNAMITEMKDHGFDVDNKYRTGNLYLDNTKQFLIALREVHFDRGLLYQRPWWARQVELALVNELNILDDIKLELLDTVNPSSTVVIGNKKVNEVERIHEQNATRENTIGFVLTPEYKLYASTQKPNQEQRIKYHSGYTRGTPVLFAGELLVIAGQLLVISNASGHYKPRFSAVLYMLDFLNRQGVDLSGTYVWRTKTVSPSVKAREKAKQTGNTQVEPLPNEGTVDVLLTAEEAAEIDGLMADRDNEQAEPTKREDARRKLLRKGFSALLKKKQAASATAKASLLSKWHPSAVTSAASTSNAAAQPSTSAAAAQPSTSAAAAQPSTSAAAAQPSTSAAAALVQRSLPYQYFTLGIDSAGAWYKATELLEKRNFTDLRRQEIPFEKLPNSIKDNLS